MSASRKRSTATTDQPTVAQEQGFDTPQQAADALIKAAGDYDVPELLAIFGPDGKDFVAGGDQVQDKNNAMDFGQRGSCQKLRSGCQVESEQGHHHRGRRRMATAGSSRQEKWQVVFQRQSQAGRRFSSAASAPTNSMPSRCAVAMLSAEGIRSGAARRHQSVRAEDHQHSRQAGWSVLEERGRHFRRAHW